MHVNGRIGNITMLHRRRDTARMAFGWRACRDDIALGLQTCCANNLNCLRHDGDAGKIIDYGVRFTKPVVVPPQGSAVVNVVATVSQLDSENRRARIDLTTSFEENNVLGKAQVWVQL